MYCMLLKKGKSRVDKFPVRITILVCVRHICFFLGRRLVPFLEKIWILKNIHTQKHTYSYEYHTSLGLRSDHYV